jgi:dolichyl-diphosphooligosaccharide--protein glycosyltransferase
MRKRAQRRFKTTFDEPEKKVQLPKKIIEKKPKKFTKNTWIFTTLVVIFLLVLFFNTFYNFTSEVAYNPDGEGFEKYYLSGPDPYYNMRIVEETYKTGAYPFYSQNDPLLNYPLGRSGGRAPLLNMMALGFSRLLTPFMSEIDAIGLSMQFIPALFGALLIFPVYFIGKELFNKKAGLIAAFFIAIIPIHIGSGHGSAFSLFDHDSFNLLLFFLTFLFLILGLREKNSTKSLLYAILGGVSLAALTMTWVEAQFLYVVIAAYAFIQMLIDIFTNKVEFKVFRTTSVLLFTGYLVSLPVILAKFGGIRLDINLALCLAVTAFGAIYYIFNKKRIPWTLSLPVIITVAGAGLVFLYFINDLIATFPFLSSLRKLSTVIFGSGIYGNKVSMTIAEANTFQISHSVMSFGPTLYWLAWGGFILLIWQYYKNKQRRDYLFIIILFIINLWLAGTAGRFLNDLVPIVAILGGWITWFLISEIDYKQMFRNIRSAGGGIHGIRRGIKVMHIFGILFIAILVIFPNVFITLDAATPNKIYEKDDGNWSNIKWDMFGEGFSGAYGLSLNKEIYWSDALDWLNDQDIEIENPVDRPAFISWWDYGFYEVAIGDHPTVADNFQDGIPPASNFHTSIGEKEAVSVWIIRLLEGDVKNNNGKISDEVRDILTDYMENDTEDIIKWIEEPTLSPSYNEPIKEEYDKNLSKEYVIGQQWPENAAYHDIVQLLNNETKGLTDDQLTWLYHDIQEATGLSIRYYGVEGYDRQIFNIFAFLADKSLILVGAPEDDFVEIYYDGYTVDSNGNIDQENLQWAAKEIIEMDDIEKRYIRVTGTSQKFKDPFFETMFYKTYIGPYQTKEDGSKDFFSYQIPCNGMKHFYAEYMSDMSNPLLQYYNTGNAAVIIAKYYEGAYINGSISFDNNSLTETSVVVYKNVSYTKDTSYPIEHDKDVTNETGHFNLIAGAGSSIQIRKNLGEGTFILKNVTFSDTKDSNYLPITDDDAMRKSDNYERFLNITIDPASINGYVFDDKDNDGEFNSSIDEPLPDLSLSIYEISSITQGSVSFGQQYPVDIDENGYYSQENLLPGYYRLFLTDEDGFSLALEDAALYSGNTSFNLIKPKLSNMEGTVYYDQNQDGELNSGEEQSDVSIELYHITRNDTNAIVQEDLIDSTTSNADGKYSFKSLIPGKLNDLDINEYQIKLEKLPDYQSSESGLYPEENKTLIKNISLGLKPVALSGEVTHNGDLIEGVELQFTKDDTVDMNTAADKSILTDETGSYSVDLQPGSYNITIEKSEGITTVYQLLGEKIVIEKGQSSITKDFSVTKKSVTVQGTTLENETIASNVSLSFMPNFSIDNNTAVSAGAESDELGNFIVELAPGAYDVEANSEPFEVDGINYTYTINEESNSLNITESQISTGLTLEIKVEKTISI